MPGVGIREDKIRFVVDTQVESGELLRRGVRMQVLVELADQMRRGDAQRLASRALQSMPDLRAQRRLHRSHQKRGADSFAGHVTDSDGQLRIVQALVVIVIAGDHACGTE
jgi:hypothetical protein